MSGWEYGAAVCRRQIARLVDPTEGVDGSVVFLPNLWPGLAVQSPVERAEERHAANGANGLNLRARAFGVLAKYADAGLAQGVSGGAVNLTATALRTLV